MPILYHIWKYYLTFLSKSGKIKASFPKVESVYYFLVERYIVMRSKIIGLTYSRKEDKEKNEVREGIQLRYSFPVKGVIGAEIRSDWVGNADILEVFRPFIISGKLDDLIGMTAYIELLPFEFKGNTIMRVVDVELLDSKETVTKVK